MNRHSTIHGIDPPSQLTEKASKGKMKMKVQKCDERGKFVKKHDMPEEVLGSHFQNLNTIDKILPKDKMKLIELLIDRFVHLLYDIINY